MNVPSVLRSARTPVRRLALVAVGLLLASAALPSADALVAYEQQVRGQVAKILTAEIGGKTHGVILSIERSTEGKPFSELRIVGSPDPAAWTILNVTGGPTAIATGDVDGDGNDDVAIGHQLEGEKCPTAAGFDYPCGIIRVYDGEGLLQGRLDVLAGLAIAPSVEACPPTTQSASTLALGDATGDGRAELAFGQLGTLEGTCGAVRVVPGDRLQGNVGMDVVCASVHGPPVQAQPDQFGAHIELIPGHLVVGAPYAGNAQGVPFAGRVEVHDVHGACQPSSSPITASTPPILVFTKSGSEPAGLMGADTAFTPGVLWIAAKDLVEGVSVPGFKPVQSHQIPRAFPLSVARDLNGDGRPELLAGPWVVTQEGEMVLQAYQFGAETFRGAVLGTDHVVTSDKFGTRLWSLADIWDPHLSLWSESASVPAGGDVKVQVAQALSLLPKNWPVQWQVAGGTVVEEGEGWVRVGDAEVGYVTVQATMEDTVATMRIPVQRAAGEISLTGADTVRVGHPFVVRVNAPEGSSIAWSAPGGVPAEGSGSTVSTQYQAAGERTVSVRVTLADGTQRTREHAVDVIEATLHLAGPTTVAQGELLRMSVDAPDDAHLHSWILEGAHTGVVRATGTSLQTPMGGWGTVNVTAVARTAQGDAVKVGHAQVTVTNLPPNIDTMQAKASQASLGVQATGAASDPGGDAVRLEWSIDGTPVGQGPALQLPLDQQGWVNVTLTAIDESGMSSSMTRPLFVHDPWGLTLPDANGTVPDLLDTPGPTDAPTVQPADEGKGQQLSVPGPGILLALALLAAVRSRRKG